MKGTALEQLAHPGAPSGDAAYWSRRDAPKLEIAPGQDNSDFVVRSSYLPGFTTAYVQGGHALATPGELPFEVGGQLAPLMRLRENNRVVLTIGPRFAPGTDSRTIAADYQKGLESLAKRGLLADKAPFYKEATRILQACARSGTDPCLVTTRAQLLAQSSSPVEEEIGSALLMALR